MPGSSSQFRTFQTVRNYEGALARHAQSILWTRAILCSCISETGQPDPQHSVCQGRGRIYKPPGHQQVYNELSKHNREGRIFPKYTPVVPSSLKARINARNDEGDTVEIMSQLRVENGNQIIEITDTDIPREFEYIYMDYAFDPVKSVISGDASVADADRGVIHIDVPVERLYGKRLAGRLISVSAVRIDGTTLTQASPTDSEKYVLLNYDNIRAVDPSLVQADSEISVDYTYTMPFLFLINNISEKQRYTSPYITQEADASLTVPSWARISPNDLFTVLAAEQIGEEIIDPGLSNTNVDSIRGYFDVVRILELYDRDGNSYIDPTQSVTTNVEIRGRSDVFWNVSKPSIPYTVQFLYNPTYVAIEGFPTLRTAENKQFVSKINLKKWSRASAIQHTH